MYKVVEEFVSINGESKKAGELAYFIRFAGCNLNCVYCDTKWANEKDVSYKEYSKEDIYSLIKDKGIKNVTLTGGEPLLRDGMEELLTFLSKDKELYIEIETNGSVALDSFIDIAENISFTMDYKCPGSGMEGLMNLNNFPLLRQSDTVKFVVSDVNDLNKMKEIIERYNLLEKCTVFVSAVFSDIEPKTIVDYMIDNKLNGLKLQLQMHKYIWDPEMKGV